MPGALHELVAVVGTVDPDAIAAGTVNTDAIDMSKFEEVLFVVMAGALGTLGTLDFKVTGDSASGGAFATDLTGKLITQLTEAGTDSDKQAVVRVKAVEVAAQGQALRFIRGELTVAVATSDAAVLALGARMDYSDAAANDLASVDQIVG